MFALYRFRLNVFLQVIHAAAAWASIHDPSKCLSLLQDKMCTAVHMHACPKMYICMPDALIAEAMAAKEGLELAVENGYDRVILEVDCRGLQTLLEDASSVRSVIGGLYFDIIGLGRSFVDFRIKWVCREANSVADVCASMVSAMERSFFFGRLHPRLVVGASRSRLYSCFLLMKSLCFSKKKMYICMI
jgi:hypothetical protein